MSDSTGKHSDDHDDAAEDGTAQGRDESAEAGDEARAVDHEPSATDDDAIDLSQVDDELAAIAAARGRVVDDAPEADLELDRVPRRTRHQRSPILSVAVLLVGAYLLHAMYADFRYWLRSDLRDLGTVSDMIRDGEFVDDFSNQYAVFTGSPDVQHAARVPHGDTYMGFLRLNEGGGSLFAAVPRATKDAPESFEGRFEGRLVRISDTAIQEALTDFFNAEQITQTHDLDQDAFVRALAAGGTLEVPDRAGEKMILGGTDVLRVVVDLPDAMVQLGRKTWPTAAEAEAAVAALGKPYVMLDRGGAPYWSFRVRVPETDHADLTATLNAGHEVPEGNSDPKVGAMVLARASSFLVTPAEIAIADGGAIALAYGDNIAVPGYDERDGRLIERPIRDGKVYFAPEALSAVRVERQITVDPDGYVILAGTTPADERTNGLLFLAVCVLMSLNLVSLVLGWRRRAAGQPR